MVAKPCRKIMLCHPHIGLGFVVIDDLDPSAMILVISVSGVHACGFEDQTLRCICNCRLGMVCLGL